ncbi:MAG: type II toxin-antitoxin system RelE/ParE family toxin [Cytophagales bacterium]
MSYQLNWTEESIKTFNQNTEYLASDWGNQVVNDFLDRVDEVLELVSLNPSVFPVHNAASKVHRCIVNRRIILYFKIVDNGRVDLLTFWNTYRDPNQLLK